MGYTWLRTNNLTKNYGDTRALDRFTVEIKEGVTLAYGPNGAGKSTLVSIMEGLVKPTSGNVQIFGTDPSKKPEFIVKKIAFLPERPQYFGSNYVLDYFYWLSGIGGASREELKRLIKVFNIEHLIRHKFSTLSMGEMQLVSLVGILSLNREVYVLDEPNENLDPFRRFTLYQEVVRKKSDGKNFLIFTHIMDELLLAVDHTISISKGKVKSVIDNKNFQESDAFSTYIASSDNTNLLNTLSSFSPRIFGEYVVIDGAGLGNILNSLDDTARSSIISGFTYPRMAFYEQDPN